MSSTPERTPTSKYLRPQAVIADKYRLESRLAEGGMGSVWVATNLVLERKVAIKVLHSDQLNELAEARLLREARAAAKIGHANIVQVFDFGHIQSGEPYIVMELLRGEDLAARLSRVGRLSAVETAKLMLPIASALAAGHAKGIIHRDLKPGNIFLALDDLGNEIPKVVDFGIAKVEVPQYAPKLTMEGRVVGSPEYLSPEQARGDDDLDATTDVWAFCVTLYETVTGDVPFHDENYNRLLRRIIEDAPRPITDYAAGDPPLWKIVARGLAKHPRARWQTMEELGRALESWLQGHNVPDIPRVRFASLPEADKAPAAGRRDPSDDAADTSDDLEPPTLLRVAPPVPGPPPSFASGNPLPPLPPAVNEALLKHGSPLGDGDDMPTRVASPPRPVEPPPPVRVDPTPSRVEAPPVYGDTRISSALLGPARMSSGKLVALVAGGLAAGGAVVGAIVLMISALPAAGGDPTAPGTSAHALPEGSSALVAGRADASEALPEPTEAQPETSAAPTASASAPPPASASSAPPADQPPVVRPPRPGRTRPDTPLIPTEPNF